MIDGGWKPERSDVRWRWDGEAGKHILVCMPLTGYVHVLNPSAAIIFAALDGTRTVDWIVGELARAYKVDRARVLSDVEKLLEMFLMVGLVVRPEAGAAAGAAD
jgi:hypothetical protein